MCLIAVLAIGTFQFLGIGIESVSANSTPQTLPFSQNWTNTGLITTNDDWSGVAGIEGYLGQDITVATGVDPQTLLTTSALANDLDAIANQTNPDTLTNGGVAEFDGIANPTIALQGSGTADAPYVLFYLNTTGASNINVAYNLRDIDGSADNSIQPVALQYRVGNTGNFTNIPAGFVADASNGPSSATLVTPVSATLPAAANNQALVQVRVITANAVGSDEWIGVDDINITAAPAVTPQHVVDFDGNGKTDFAVVRNTGGGPGGQITWFINLNGVGTTYASAWGISGDFFTPVDFDGDNKTDIAIWRAGAPTVAAFYILQSATNTVRIEAFGQTGDDPSVVDDYDGDGKADPAVYRAGANSGDPSTWFYRGSLSNPSGNVTYVNWGQNGDFPAPGDYDGDGKNDFVVQRNNGGGQARFWMLQTTAGFNSIVFGTPTDVIVPGDYDGDGKTDLAVVRGSAGQYNWYVRPSSTGAISGAPTAIFGASATDFPAQGDYDGDGKTEPAIWRPSATPGASAFWALGSTSGAFSVPFGQNGDYPVANYNRH
ncbi:MAG TPA: VCBS repeat-containing protein [Pyrinomonadaceae bacterium]|nr:VCBS repeat-containing protein [Pyrinomonadaceae bacterium]